MQKMIVIIVKAIWLWQKCDW